MMVGGWWLGDDDVVGRKRWEFTFWLRGGKIREPPENRKR